MIVVTSGSQYVDIDVLGTAVAYAELLRVEGHDAIACSSAPYNESVPPLVRAWDFAFADSEQYTPQANDQFAIVDLSNPEYFDPMVRLDQVTEVIDHHVGFEAYWAERPRVRTQIEFIGAACTLVYERWVASGRLQAMSPVSARLLVCGILDNTLNFGADVTTDRDRQAYDALLPISGLDTDWPMTYFSDCQNMIVAELPAYVRASYKTPELQTFGGKVLAAQLALWDAHAVLAKTDIIASTIGGAADRWFVNLISLCDGKSYFLCSDDATGRALAGLLGLTPADGTWVADRLWLRKEIFKRDLGTTH